MPFVNIRIVRESLVEDGEGKKARIARRVAEAVHEETGVAKSAVWAVFEEVAAKDWYLGEDSVEALRKRRS
jgi:4-oxalocrotonate tautomerase